ncbi:MAG: phytoene desaturase family protein [Promethearchaeota archaeon]
MVENNSNNNAPDYDIIVIGAGMGGLVSANILTKEGYKVLIVEKNSFPGGYCTNFKRKDYIFDVALHWTGGCELNGTINTILKKFNAENCVEFIKLNELYHWIDYENNIDFYSPTSFQKFIDSLITTFPNEKEKIKKFYDLYGNILDNKIIGSLLNKKVSDIINPFNFNSALKNLITAEMGLFKWPPDDLSALFFITCVVSHYLKGTYYIKGGSGAFSKAIAEIFVKNGGTLKLSTEVIRITFEDDLANGIIAKNKEKKKIRDLSQSINRKL